MGYIIDWPFQKLEPLVGAPPDHLKVIFILLVSYPLAHVYIRIPNNRPYTKHLFSICLSSFYLLGMFRLWTGWLQLVGDCVLTWWICKSGIGRGRGGGKAWMPWLVFVLMMGHLLINHLYRELTYIPLSQFEITGPQMVLIMKLITFAWNIQDGDPTSTPLSSLDSEQIGNKINPEEFPSLIEFLGHCLFFPQVLTGPGADYASYKALVEGTLFVHPPATTASSALANSNADENATPLPSRPTTPNPSSSSTTATVISTSTSKPTSKSNRLRPSGRKNAAYKKCALGLFFLGIYALYGSKFGYEHVLDKPWWRSIGWGKRIGFVQVAGLLARSKYYAFWSICEGACILTGIGFNGYDVETKKPLWDRVVNVNVWGIETSQSYKVLFDSWNTRANVWLRDTIYKRVTPKGKKPGVSSTLTTFMTSALWHGIAPGYYLAFVTAGFCTSLGRPFRHLIRPFFLPPPGQTTSLQKIIYDLSGWICVQLTLNYLASAFILLKFRDCIRAWHAMGWYGHVMIFVTVVFLRVGGRKWLVKMNKKRGNVGTEKKGGKAA